MLSQRIRGVCNILFDKRLQYLPVLGLTALAGIDTIVRLDEAPTNAGMGMKWV